VQGKILANLCACFAATAATDVADDHQCRHAHPDAALPDYLTRQI
jgi:hypothetical protein